MQAHNAADSRVIVNREMGALVHTPGAPKIGTFPALHHGVLQLRKLIGIVVGIIQRPLNEPRIDPASSKLYGLADHIFPLITRHAGHEELAPADRFGKTVKAGAVTDGPRPQ